MNNQTDLTIVSDTVSDDYELCNINETADSIYWTLNLYNELTHLYNNLTSEEEKEHE